MSEQNELSHFPRKELGLFGPPNDSWTAAGQTGAETGNLSLGVFGPAAIDGYIKDHGDHNMPVGHRRWILYSRAKIMGTGDVPGGPTPKSNALVVVGGFKPGSVSQWVSWPNAGYAPVGIVYPRWSLSRPGVTFGSATVTMTDTIRNSNIGNNIVYRHTGGPSYGDPTIVWEPDWSDYGGTPPLDTPITVTVSRVSGSRSSHAYTVTVIDPNDLAENVTISGINTPPVSGAAYSFTTVSQALGYELSVARPRLVAWSEGAEDFSASQVIEQATYPGLRSTAFKHTGSKSFHLTIADFDVPEGFELDRTLLVEDMSELHFHHRMQWAASGTKLLVQVSTDGGYSWSTVWTRAGNDGMPDNSWGSATCSLRSLSGQIIRLRFRLEHKSGSVFLGTNANKGFYVDDIQVKNALQLETAEVTQLAASATGFILNDVTAGATLEYGTSYYLQVRPKVGGQWFGFGPSLLVVPEKEVQEIEAGWRNAQSHDGGWRTMEWFGNYYESSSGWIYHEDLKWLFRAEGEVSSAWLWHPSLGWLWTNEDIFPFLYMNNWASWLWYWGSPYNAAYLFDELNREWFLLETND